MSDARDDKKCSRCGWRLDDPRGDCEHKFVSSKAPTHCDLCCKPKTEQPCGATHCPGNRLSRELVIETARELFGFYGWDNERDQKMRKRIEVMRNMALSLLSMPSATLLAPKWLVRAGGDSYQTWLCAEIHEVQRAFCEALYGDVESADAHDIGFYMDDFQKKEWDQEVLRWSFEDGWLEVVRLSHSDIRGSRG